MVAPTNPDAPRKDDTVVFEDGVYRPGYKDAVQPRGWTGAAWDTGIDVAKTAIDVLQSPVTLLRDATAQPSGGDARDGGYGSGRAARCPRCQEMVEPAQDSLRPGAGRAGQDPGGRREGLDARGGRGAGEFSACRRCGVLRRAGGRGGLRRGGARARRSQPSRSSCCDLPRGALARPTGTRSTAGAGMSDEQAKQRSRRHAG